MLGNSNDVSACILKPNKFNVLLVKLPAAHMRRPVSNPD